MSRDVRKLLADPQVFALRCAGDDWPRTFLSILPIPDSWMGLIERLDGRRNFVPAGESPRLDDSDRLLLVRNRRLTLPLAESAAVSACGNDIRITGELLVYWPAREDELAALGRTLLRADTLTLAEIESALFNGGIRRALPDFARAAPAEELLQTDQREALTAAIRAMLQSFSFESGLLIDRVTAVTFTSTSYARRKALEKEHAARVEQMQSRAAMEQTALANAQRRLAELSAVYNQMKPAPAAPNAAPGSLPDPTAAGSSNWRDMLAALAPAERTRLLENLWRVSPSQKSTRAIVVVAGQQVLWLDPPHPTAIALRVTLPIQLGGLRSIRFDATRDELLIGAAAGVWRLSAADGAIRAAHQAPSDRPPRTGFNAAVIAADALYATSSQLGCWRWPLDDATPAVCMLKPEADRRAIRCAIATGDGRVLFVADQTLYLIEPGPSSSIAQPLGSSGVVLHALVILGDALFAATDDGRVLQTRLSDPTTWVAVYQTPLRVAASAADPARAAESLMTQASTAAIESLAVRHWSDLTEVVVPAGGRGVLGVFVEEGCTAPLLTPALPVRRAWAGDDALVALSDLRDRLFILTSHTPGRAGVELPVRSLLNELVQDVCLTTTPA